MILLIYFLFQKNALYSLNNPEYTMYIYIYIYFLNSKSEYFNDFWRRLKTGAMAAEDYLCHHRNKYNYTYIFK